MARAPLIGAAVAVVVGFALGPVGAGAQARVTTVAALAPPQFPEGLAVDAQGNVYLGFAPTGEIRRLAPGGAQSTLATLRPGEGILLGLAVDAQGTVYAALNSANSPNSDAHGVWRIGRDGARSLLAALPPNGVPNGLALDARGNVYVADSALGTIWRVTPQGAVSAWVEHPLLRGGRDACPPGELPFDVGVNGIAFDRRGDLYAAVMDRGLIVRVPVNRDGSAGAPVVFAGPDCANLEGADGIAFDALGNLYVAVNHKNTVVRLTPAGRLDTLATGADGLDFPATVAFARPGGQGDLYLANFAFVSGDAARPSLMRLAVAAPGALPRTGGGPGAVGLAGAAAAAGVGLALAGLGARARRRR